MKIRQREVEEDTSVDLWPPHISVHMYMYTITHPHTNAPPHHWNLRGGWMCRSQITCESPF